MAGDELRVGLIGAGWIAESHVPEIEAADGAALVAVCDVDRDRARAIAAPRGAQAYVDWSEMLEGERLDALWVCTPPLHHREPTIAALQRGVAVYLEKPIARDVADGEAIVAAAAAPGAPPCAVGYMWRGSELLERVRAAVTPGEVAMLVSRNYGPVAGRGWFMDRTQSGGQILERASHHIDLQRAIAGEVSSVSATGATAPLAQHGTDEPGIEDALVLVLHYANGAVGTISVAWTAPDQPSTHGLDVMDPRCTLSLRLGPGAFAISGLAGGEAVQGSYGDPLRRSVRRLLALARGDASVAPFCTPQDALGSLRVAVAAERSLVSGGGAQALG